MINEIDLRKIIRYYGVIYQCFILLTIKKKHNFALN